MNARSISILVFISVATYSAPPFLHDMPIEYKYTAEQKRMPQFILDLYSTVKDTAKELHNALTGIPSHIYAHLFEAHNYSSTPAYVRYTPQDELCSQERVFIEKRLSLVKQHLQEKLHLQLDESRIPRIACCFSGGGFRAMMMTFGFLSAAHETGLLHTALYLTGLSGSTWAIAPWIASGKPLPDFFKPLTENLYAGVDHISETNELSQMIKIIINKMYFKQIVSVVDIYGNIIANTLLKHIFEKPMEMTLSQSHQHIVNGSHPMPIYTAIQSNLQPYEWLEFTPFEVGSSYLKSYIPIWALGRKFKQGISTNTPPEQTLGFCMGVFGSAFGVTLKDVVRLTADNIAHIKTDLPSFIYEPLKKVVLALLNSFIGDIRFFPAILSNFSYLHPKSPIKNEKNISLVDAGIDFNLPLPPLLRTARKVDIIIIYDASSSVTGAPELVLAEKYAQRKGIKFPKINTDGIDQRPVSIFKDEFDPETPVIIYFPRIKNSLYSSFFDPEECIENGYCNTYNFAYTNDQIKQLCGLPEFTLKQHTSVIDTTIKDVLTRKYNYDFATA